MTPPSDAPPSVREIDRRLTGPGERFEITTIDLDRRPTRVWRNAPLTVCELLDTGAERGGDRPFLVLGDERVSHIEHRDRALRLAQSFVLDLGVRPGDRVAIALRNVPEWSIAFFATAYAGAVAVAVNAFWTGAELAFAISDCTPTVLVADGERLERLAGHTGHTEDIGCLAGVTVVGTHLDDRKTAAPLPDSIVAFDSLLDRPATPLEVTVAPDDLVAILYTSGTTSHPKGVMATHRSLATTVFSTEFVQARGMMRAGVTPPLPPPAAGVTLVPVPLFHGTGLYTNLLVQAWLGGTIVMMRKWDPEEALDLVERERVTGLSGVPTMAWELVSSPSIAGRDLSSLRSVGGGGAAAPPELGRRVKAVLPGCGSGTGYGMTESTALTASIGGADYAERPRSVGVPVPIVTVQITGDDGRPVPDGDVGEIWMSGVTVARGYWNRPEATEETFGAGWLRSGDLGRLDDDGYLYIVDRAKDMVIRGGENISSIEVEVALFDHPGVAEAAVFPVPHEVLGEEVGAVVLRAPGVELTADEIRSFAAERLAPFKVPAHVWITDEPFPRGPTGKTQKRDLKAQYLTRPGS